MSTFIGICYLKGRKVKIGSIQEGYDVTDYNFEFKSSTRETNVNSTITFFGLKKMSFLCKINLGLSGNQILKRKKN